MIRSHRNTLSWKPCSRISTLKINSSQQLGSKTEWTNEPNRCVLYTKWNKAPLNRVPRPSHDNVR